MTKCNHKVLQGPPFVSGDLHIGHGINLIIKDFVLRYQINSDPFKFVYNYDCHGLPTERQIEKKLARSDPNFLKTCLDYVKVTSKKMSSVIDALKLKDQTSNNELLTVNLDYKVRLIQFLKSLYDRGLIYRSLKHVNYCYYCSTTLANAEIVNLEHKVPVYVVKALLTSGEYKGYNLLFATTELTTIPFNCAIALNQNHQYHLNQNEKIISGLKNPGQKSIKANFLQDSTYEIVSKEGKLFSKGVVVVSSIVHSDSETSEKSSLLSQFASVSLSPWNNPKDYDVICDKLPHLQNRILNENDRAIKLRQEYLKKENQLIGDAPIVQIFYQSKNYDSCWRCNNRSGYALNDQWYLKIGSEIRKKICYQLQKVNFNSSKLKTQTIKFFEKDVDWAITRSRVYGTPFPVATCSNCKTFRAVTYNRSDFLSEEECFYSHLDLLIAKKSHLQKDLICECGKTLEALKLSTDVWIDSAFLPLYYGTTFDYFVEGIDQMRGWFYGTAILYYLQHQKLPYRNLVYLGWVENNGRKISKSTNTLGTLDQLLKKVDLNCLKSYALTNANYNNTEFSLELIDSQKKYTNNIKNCIKFIAMLKKEVQNFTKEQVYQKYPELMVELELFLEKIKSFFKQLKFDKYWYELKNHFLMAYSRKLINEHKKSLTPDLKKLLIYYGETLLTYVKPVLPDLVD